MKDLAQFWYSTTKLPVTDEQRLAWLARYGDRARPERPGRFDRPPPVDRAQGRDRPARPQLAPEAGAGTCRSRTMTASAARRRFEVRESNPARTS